MRLTTPVERECRKGHLIGKFDVPLPEPTLEELAEQEALRKKREKQREYIKRY